MRWRSSCWWEVHLEHVWMCREISSWCDKISKGGFQRLHQKPEAVIVIQINWTENCFFFWRSVKLNGAVLKMVDDKTFPDLSGARLPPAEHLQLPAYSLAFFVLVDAKATACRWHQHGHLAAHPSSLTGQICCCAVSFSYREVPWFHDTQVGTFKP